jgi:hypothetical protein
MTRPVLSLACRTRSGLHLFVSPYCEVQGVVAGSMRPVYVLYCLVQAGCVFQHFHMFEILLPLKTGYSPCLEQSLTNNLAQKRLCSGPRRLPVSLMTVIASVLRPSAQQDS